MSIPAVLISGLERIDNPKSAFAFNAAVVITVQIQRTVGTKDVSVQTYTK